MYWLRRTREPVLVLAAIVVDLYVYQSDHEVRWGGTAPAWLVPVLAGLVYCTLLGRWRWPKEIFAVQWVYGLAGLVLPGYAPFAGILISLHAVASSIPRRWSSTALGLSFVALAVDNDNAAAAKPTSALDLFISLNLAWLAILTAIWLVGRRTYLTARRSELQRLSDEQAAADVVLAERAELARELHDTLARSLNAMIYQARGASAVLAHDSAQVRDCLSRIEDAGVRAVDELRRLLEVLRRAYPAVTASEATWSAPSLAGVPALLALARDGGLAVEFVSEGTRTEVEASVEAAAYRVIEEGLTNASKHSGPGTLVHVRMTWSPDLLAVEVRNSTVTGVPHAPPSGFGLKGLRERVVLAGGALTSGPSPDRSEYVLRAGLPLVGVSRPPITEKAFE